MKTPGKGGRISNAEAELLGRMGQQQALMIGALARDFCQACEMPNDEQYFNAALFSLLETVVFITVCGARESQRERRQAVDDLHKSLKKLLLDYTRSQGKPNEH